MLSTESLAKLSDLRRRVLQNEHVADEELQEALKLLADNRAVVTQQRESKPRTSIAVPDSASLLASIAAKVKEKKD